MDRERASIVVRELGTHIGSPDLGLDESNTAVIALDKGPAMTVGFSAVTGTLELMIYLDHIPLSAPVMLAVLSANFVCGATEGAVFAVTGDVLVLQRSCNDTDAANGGFVAAAESLVATASAWSERLAAIAAPSEPGPAHVPAGMVRA